MWKDTICPTIRVAFIHNHSHRLQALGKIANQKRIVALNIFLHSTFISNLVFQSVQTETGHVFTPISVGANLIIGFKTCFVSTIKI